MSTIRSTVSAVLAVAVISASALFATTGSSMAGGYGYGYGYGYGNGYGHGYQLVYQPRCQWTKIKVWTHYGWQWQKVKVCN